MSQVTILYLDLRDFLAIPPRIVVAVILLTCFYSHLASADAGTKPAELNVTIKPGDYVLGPGIRNWAEGRQYVAFMYWGVRCSRCKKNLARFSALADKMSSDRIVFVAANCHEQGRTGETWSLNGGGRSVTVMDSGEVLGLRNEAFKLPRVVFISPNGTILYDGMPDDSFSGFLSALVVK